MPTPDNLPPLTPEDKAATLLPWIALGTLFFLGSVVPAVLKFFGIEV